MPLFAQVSFATALLDKPLTTGVYRVFRNPEYFSVFLRYLGMSVACVSWVFMVCAVAWIISFHVEVVRYEEPFLIEKYGDAYRGYMNRTPRWIGIPKSGQKG